MAPSVHVPQVKVGTFFFFFFLLLASRGFRTAISRKSNRRPTRKRAQEKSDSVLGSQQTNNVNFMQHIVPPTVRSQNYICTSIKKKKKSTLVRLKTLCTLKLEFTYVAKKWKAKRKKRNNGQFKGLRAFKANVPARKWSVHTVFSLPGFLYDCLQSNTLTPAEQRQHESRPSLWSSP